MTTILCADDSAHIREFLQQELEEEGYRVLLARDGFEAVAMTEKERPDLAILDIWMPRVSGLEAAERIAAIDPDIRIIFFTNNDELCIHDHRSAYASACIEKGQDFSEMKRTIISVLNACREKPPMRLGLPPIKPGPDAFRGIPTSDRGHASPLGK